MGPGTLLGATWISPNKPSTSPFIPAWWALQLIEDQLTMLPEFVETSSSGPCSELLARIAIMKRSASGKQADGLTCDDVFRCSGLCDFCNALEFF
jgi:hypothetical protein